MHVTIGITQEFEVSILTSMPSHFTLCATRGKKLYNFYWLIVDQYFTWSYV